MRLKNDLPNSGTIADLIVDTAMNRRKAWSSVQAKLGTVRVIEEGEHVVAEVDLGRWYINHGAEERT